MTEEFDRSGVALLTANPTTVYQVPSDTAGATSLVLSCLAAHVADSNATASIELRIVSSAGQVLGTPVRRALIGPGMAVELVPNRHVLGPGERVQAIASSGGLLSILISVLGPELSPNRRGIANVEAYARFIPPETVGSNKNIVNVGSVVEADVNFRAPAIRIGVVVRPPALAATAGPVVPALAFGAVTIEAPSRNIALSAGVPFVGSAVEAVVVPGAGLTLTAATPVVATGSGAVVPAAQLALSAPEPSVVTAAALDSDAAAYIAAVEAVDGQSLEADVKTAINSFVVGCKADGIWTALKASCILAGARTLGGALTPLKGTAPTNFNFWGNADPNWASVSLLLRMNGANASTTFTDSSSNVFTVTTAGNAQISTAQSKFGGSSGLFDGNGDWCQVANNAAFKFGSGNFTIEYWFYPTNLTSVKQHINPDDGTNTSYAILTSGSSLLYYLSSVGGSTWDIASGVSIGTATLNTWQHIALVRNGNVFTPYLNGIAGTATTSSAALFDFTSVLRIGSQSTNTAPTPFQGHIDDFRITKGVARYTANFTPPTQTFPGSTADYNRETGLVGDGSTKYLDSSRNNNADPQNSKHLAVFCSSASTATASGRTYIGMSSSVAGSSWLHGAGTSNNLSVRANTSTSLFDLPSSSALTGLIGVARDNSATSSYRYSGTTSSGSAASVSPGSESIKVFLGISVSSYSNARLAFYSIGESLDLALLDTRVTRLLNEIEFSLNTGLPGTGYDIDTLKYINAGYAAGGSLG